jgi:hypothetical protein
MSILFRKCVIAAAVAALVGCSAADKSHEPQQSAPTAATSAEPKIPADKVEVRLLVSKAALPATLTTEPSAKDQAARTTITGKDLAVLEGAIRGKGLGSVGPKCFRVCETQCFGAGESQTCVPRCHIECID